MKQLKINLALRGAFAKIKAKFSYQGNNIFLLIFVGIAKFASNFIGLTVICVFGLSYISNLWNQPADKVTVTGFAALSIIMALSVLALTIAPFITDEEIKNRVIFSGERFFHGSIFLIQAIILKYASEVKTVMITFNIEIMSAVLKSLASFVATTAFIHCMVAFEAIDNILWYLNNLRLFKFDEDRESGS